MNKQTNREAEYIKFLFQYLKAIGLFEYEAIKENININNICYQFGAGN